MLNAEEREIVKKTARYLSETWDNDTLTIDINKLMDARRELAKLDVPQHEKLPPNRNDVVA